MEYHHPLHAALLTFTRQQDLLVSNHAHLSIKHHLYEWLSFLEGFLKFVKFRSCNTFIKLFFQWKFIFGCFFNHKIAQYDALIWIVKYALILNLINNHFIHMFFVVSIVIEDSFDFWINYCSREFIDFVGEVISGLIAL